MRRYREARAAELAWRARQEVEQQPIIFRVDLAYTCLSPLHLPYTSPVSPLHQAWRARQQAEQAQREALQAELAS